ncbi:TolC family protein [Abyssibacter sp.]|uniref:TolC family protein n=1 Tax=Abyssibacter sp. TaxID=2320200 RepID=UPI000C5E2B92|nr:hypothetical protein [Xanthomonadales bacterium]
MFPILLKGGAVLALSLVAAQAAAEPQRIPATLPGVLQWTLQHHPELRRMDAVRQAQSGYADTAEFGPPLTLQTEVENVAGNGEFAGADRLETTISLAGVLEWGGKPMLRRTEALSRAEVERVELDQQRRDLLADAATRFVELARAEADARLLRDAVVVAEQTAEASDQRQRAGAASAADAQRASLALAAARLRASQAQTRRRGAAQALAIVVGTPNRGVTTTRMDWTRLPAPPARSRLLESARHAPLVRLATADRDLALARVRLAASQARGDLQWSVGVRDDRGSGDQALVLGLGLPLGSARRSAPAQASAQAQAEATHWAQQTARLSAQALVTTAWAELDALHQAFEQIRDALEPQSEAVLRATAEGYRQGRYSLLELTTAQQERLAWQQRRIAVATEYHQTRIELERLLGRSLDQEIAG